MDCGNEYIKMCEKAEEIQNDWKREYSDYYITSLKDNCFQGLRILFNPKDYSTPNSPIGIWLPRQDQLQTIISSMVYSLDHFFMKDSIEIFRCCIGEWIFCGDSFEQVLLQTVMKVRYNEVWDRTDWKEVD